MKTDGKFALIVSLIGLIGSVFGVLYNVHQFLNDESKIDLNVRHNIEKFLSQPLLSLNVLKDLEIDLVYDTMDIKEIEDQVEKITSLELSSEVRVELIDMKIRIGLLEKMNEKKADTKEESGLLILLFSILSWFFSGAFGPTRDHVGQIVKDYILKKSVNQSSTEDSSVKD